jgi:integrase/recombinase XerD
LVAGHRCAAAREQVFVRSGSHNCQMPAQLVFPTLGLDEHESAPSRAALVREGYLATVETPGTRRVYANDLDVYWRWCQERGLEPLAATVEQIEDWAAFQVNEQPDLRRDPRGEPQAGGRSASVVRRRLGAVSRLMRFAIDAGERAKPNPVALERPPAQDPDAQAVWLSAREVAAVLDHACDSGALPHAVCSLVFLYAQPGTQTHLIERGDVALGGAPQIRLAMRCARRVLVRLDGRALQAVGELLAAPGAPGWPLIATPGRPERPLPAKEVGRLVTRTAAEAGIDDVTLIVVRHTFCALAREAHFSDDAIRRYTGARWGAARQWQRSQPPSPPQAIEALLAGSSRPAPTPARASAAPAMVA